MNLFAQACQYKNFTATNTVYTGNCIMVGIFVASTSAGTLKISDGATTVVNTFNATAGTFYPIPAVLNTSLVITVTGTIDATVFWNT